MAISIAIALIIVFAIALRLAVPGLTRDSVASGIVSKDGQSSLGDCPDTPNCQGSESTRVAQTVERFVATEQAIDTLAKAISNLPGSAIVEQTDRYLHATFTTRIMGYVDDLEFLLSDDKNSVQVRSASRLGKSDLGVNANRIKQLRDLVSNEL